MRHGGVPLSSSANTRHAEKRLRKRVGRGGAGRAPRLLILHFSFSPCPPFARADRQVRGDSRMRSLRVVGSRQQREQPVAFYLLEPPRRSFPRLSFRGFRRGIVAASIRDSTSSRGIRR